LPKAEYAAASLAMAIDPRLPGGPLIPDPITLEHRPDSLRAERVENFNHHPDALEQIVEIS
jgi:hypothetical protein